MWTILQNLWIKLFGEKPITASDKLGYIEKAIQIVENHTSGFYEFPHVQRALYWAITNDKGNCDVPVEKVEMTLRKHIPELFTIPYTTISFTFGLEIGKGGNYRSDRFKYCRWNSCQLGQMTNWIDMGGALTDNPDRYMYNPYYCLDRQLIVLNYLKEIIK